MKIEIISIFADASRLWDMSESFVIALLFWVVIITLNKE